MKCSIIVNIDMNKLDRLIYFLSIVLVTGIGGNG